MLHVSCNRYKDKGSIKKQKRLFGSVQAFQTAFTYYIYARHCSCMPLYSVNL